MISNMFPGCPIPWPSSSPGLKLGCTMPSGQLHKRRIYGCLMNSLASWWRLGFNLVRVNHIVLLAFMEYLVLNQISPANISNYLAGIRAQFIVFNLDTTYFQHQQIQYFLRSLKINRPLQPKIHKHIDIQLLTDIIHITDTLQHPNVFKTLYILAYFSFLRLSNILPHTVTSFDNTRHLAKVDIIIAEDQVLIIIKWSKTIQNRQDIRTISLPILGVSKLCPATALRSLLALTPGDSNDPLFQTPRAHASIPLTDSVARRHLHTVSNALKLSPHLTFHDFRRSGATWAFHHGVPLSQIMHHGTWKSDSVWKYINDLSTKPSMVSTTFQQHLPS